MCFKDILVLRPVYFIQCDKVLYVIFVLFQVQNFKKFIYLFAI